MSVTAHQLRCCTACGTPLEDWPNPLAVGSYTPCYPCGLVYLVTPDGVDRVDRDQLPAELAGVVDAFAELWWELQIVPVPVAG